MWGGCNVGESNRRRPRGLTDRETCEWSFGLLRSLPFKNCSSEFATRVSVVAAPEKKTPKFASGRPSPSLLLCSFVYCPPGPEIKLEIMQQGLNGRAVSMGLWHGTVISSFLLFGHDCMERGYQEWACVCTTKWKRGGGRSMPWHLFAKSNSQRSPVL